MICYNYPRVYLSLFSFKSSICGTSRRISQLPEAQRWQQTPKIATWIMHELHISLSHMLFTSTNKGKERSPFPRNQSCSPIRQDPCEKFSPKHPFFLSSVHSSPIPISFANTPLSSENREITPTLATSLDSRKFLETLALKSRLVDMRGEISG